MEGKHFSTESLQTLLSAKQYSVITLYSLWWLHRDISRQRVFRVGRRGTYMLNVSAPQILISKKLKTSFRGRLPL